MENNNSDNTNYVQLDNEFGSVLRNMAFRFMGIYTLAAATVEQIINEQVFYLNQNNINHIYYKNCLIVATRQRCLEYLRTVDFATVLTLESNASVLFGNARAYVACNRINGINKIYEEENVENLLKKRKIVTAILADFKENDREIFIRRYYYMQSAEEISQDTGFDSNMVYKRIGRLRNRFIDMYRELLKNNKINCTELNGFGLKYINMLSNYADRFSYMPDFREAIKYIPIYSVKEGFIVNILGVLSYIELSREKDMSESMPPSEDSDDNVSEEDTYDDNEFFERYEIQENTREKLVVNSTTNEKKSIRNIISWAVVGVILLAMIIVGAKLITDTNRLNLNNESIEGELVYTATSEEMGMTFEYYYNKINDDINIKVTQNYYVDNNFVVDLTHGVSKYINEMFTGDIVINDYYNYSKSGKGYSDGDIKFVYCKYLDIIYAIQYKQNGGWSAKNPVDVAGKSTSSEYIVNDMNKVTKISYYSDADMWTGNYKINNNISKIRFMNDDYTFEKNQYYNADNGITLTQYYDKNSKRIQQKVNVDDSHTQEDSFFCANENTENGIDYLSIYYCYKNKDSYSADFICKLAINDIFESVGKCVDFGACFSNINKYGIYVDKLSSYIFLDKSIFPEDEDSRIYHFDAKSGLWEGEYIVGLHGKYMFTGRDYYNSSNKNLSKLTLMTDKSNDNRDVIMLFTKQQEELNKGNTNMETVLSEVYPEYYLNNEKGIIKETKDYRYADFNGVIEILEYLGVNEDVSIPETINESTVRYISNGAFYGKSTIKSVTVPKTVVEIGYDAFGHCANLDTVVICEGVKAIGQSAFELDPGLKYVDLPDSLIMIGDSCFEGTKWYDKLCESVNDATYDGLYIGKILYTINSSLLDNKTEFTIKDGTVAIACNALDNIKTIKRIVIPESVKYIGSYAFNGMESLELVNLDSNIEYIGEYAFSECKSLERVTVPGTIKEIKAGMFTYCKNLRYAEFMDGVKIIQSTVFCNNDKLEGVLLPESVVAIHSNMFSNTGNTIVGYAGSYALDYANTWDIDFKLRK